MSASPLKVDLEKDGALLRLRLSRPKANIIDAAMIAALRSALDAHLPDARLRGVLLEAEGPHFSFGASVEEHLPGSCATMLRELHALVLQLVGSPVPVLVAVQVAIAILVAVLRLVALAAARLGLGLSLALGFRGRALSRGAAGTAGSATAAAGTTAATATCRQGTRRNRDRDGGTDAENRLEHTLLLHEGFNCRVVTLRLDAPPPRAG